MKKIIFFGLILLMALGQNSSLEAAKRVRFRMILTGETVSLNSQIKKGRIYVRFRQKGGMRDIYSTKIWGKREGDIYTFRIAVYLKGIVGSTMEGEAYANLKNGSKVFNKFEFPITPGMSQYSKKIILSYDGKKQNEEELKPVKAQVFITGTTENMRERLSGNNFTVKMKYADEKEWLIDTKVPFKTKRTINGYVYSCNFNDFVTVDRNKKFDIEVTGTLRDGREISGTTRTILLTAGWVIRGKVALNKIEGKPQDEGILIKGNISVSKKAVQKLGSWRDRLDDRSPAIFTIRDRNYNLLVQMSIPLKKARGNLYTAEIDGRVADLLKRDTYYVDVVVKTIGGNSVNLIEETVQLKDYNGQKAILLNDLEPVFLLKNR